MKRVFLVVMDSVGIGEMPDASEYGDHGSNTLSSVSKDSNFDMKNMKRYGLFNIDGIKCYKKSINPKGSYARMAEASKGKDTIIGHWEIAGIKSKNSLPVFPDGFPEDIISKFEELTGKKIICNKPYSGTKVLLDYGNEHVETGDLIVYTSADSVFQIAAHEDIVPIEDLYKYCEIAREILVDDVGVGRVIARPFIGEYPEYKRTSNRHDYSLLPPKDTMLNKLIDNGKYVLAVGKINDIFAGSGITEFIRTKNNEDGMQKTIGFVEKEFEGLCFLNLVDFDMLYGHRNDVSGYAKSLAKFDEQISILESKLKEDDILIVTADHGCDPSTKSTDHSREYVPMIILGNKIKKGINLGTRERFSDIAATILEYFDIRSDIERKSILKKVIIDE